MNAISDQTTEVIELSSQKRSFLELRRDTCGFSPGSDDGTRITTSDVARHYDSQPLACWLYSFSCPLMQHMSCALVQIFRCYPLGGGQVFRRRRVFIIWRRAICLRQLHFVKGLHRIKIPGVRRTTFLVFKEDIPCVRRRTILVFKEGYSLPSKKDIPCVQRKIFLVFKERHSLCSKKDIPCVRGRKHPNFWSYRPQEWCI